MNRGARREAVFLSDDHALIFLECMGCMAERFGVEIHAFVLMPNHYHMLLRSVRGNLSRAMQFFGGEYTRRINIPHRWDGPIFRGRFRSELIEEEQHLRHVVPYIHLNPCRAGLVIRPQEFLWSSYSDYSGETTPQPWLVRREILDLFGSRDDLLNTTEALRTLREPWHPDLDSATGFFEGRKHRLDEEKARIPGPHVSPEEVLRLLKEVTSSSDAELLAPGRGRSANPLRRLSAWALRRHAGLSHNEVGAILRIAPSAVSQILARLRQGAPASNQIRGWMEALDTLVIKR